jgi:dihydrofolate reductase
MRVNLIVARARNGVIGANGTIPWRVPGEMAYFKQVTLGHPIVMGRKTWESLPRRPLPGRRNLVVTRNASYAADGAEVVASLDEALARCAGVDEVFVIGGAELFAQALPQAGRAFVTEIDIDVVGDTHFPALDPAQWRAVSRRRGDSEPAHDFVVYERTS